MNAHVQAIAAYGTPTNAHKTPRSIEYDVFAQVTAKLREAEAGDSKSFPQLAAALHENRRLWRELAFDLAAPGNKLPDVLKAKLLGLAQFTLNQSDAILENKSSASVLIDINIAIMRGLKGQGDMP